MRLFKARGNGNNWAWLLYRKWIIAFCSRLVHSLMEPGCRSTLKCGIYHINQMSTVCTPYGVGKSGFKTINIADTNAVLCSKSQSFCVFPWICKVKIDWSGAWWQLFKGPSLTSGHIIGPFLLVRRGSLVTYSLYFHLFTSILKVYFFFIGSVSPPNFLLDALLRIDKRPGLSSLRQFILPEQTYFAHVSTTTEQR